MIAQTRFSILNGRGEKLIELAKFKKFKPNSEERFDLDAKTMNKLRQRSLVNPLVDSDDFTICLDFDIPTDDLDDPFQVDDMAGQLDTTSSDDVAGQSIAKLTDDLGNLLIDGHLSDVVLLVGDRKFPVHRAILAARSPVFRAMFTSNMKESVAEEIQIEDMEPDVMEELLRCVYTDQVPVECGCDMLIAFDRFGLISLFDRCQKSLLIEDENALELFALGDDLKAKHLKMRILEFLKNREAHMLPETD